MRIPIVVRVCLVVMLGTGCSSQVRFSESPSGVNESDKISEKKEKSDENAEVKAAAKDADVAPKPSDERWRSYEFLLQQEKAKVDMVWALDTSDSMENEMEYVQSNMAKFVKSLNDSTDLQVAILGTECGSKKPTPPTVLPKPLCIETSRLAAPNVKTLDFHVNSLDALVVLSDESKKEGALGAFYREQSKKVFVVVSDDDSFDMPANEFLPSLTDVRGLGRPQFFAFASREKTQNALCDVAWQGEQYLALSKMTEGVVYDICEKDWSVHFDKLRQDVVSVAQRRFEVKAESPVTSVRKVTLWSSEGKARELLSEQYFFSNGVLELKEGVLPTNVTGFKLSLEVTDVSEE
jgi:hypothetical protein